jgi:hypothetical protein
MKSKRWNKFKKDYSKELIEVELTKEAGKLTAKSWRLKLCWHIGSRSYCKNKISVNFSKINLLLSDFREKKR